MNEALTHELEHKFSASKLTREDSVHGMKDRSDLDFFQVGREQAVPMISWLRDVAGFTHLVLFTAVDFIEHGQFQLTYVLHAPSAKTDITILVFINREAASMDSIHFLWPHAATYQQELYEMFGITFPGSPRLYEDFALEGWEDIPPMRREFDTRDYSEKTYFPRPGRKTHDTREYMKQKLYPSEAETW